MPRDFRLPDLGEGITEAQIIRVLIEQGETVAEDQYLMEVETDKAAVEIPSPYAGIAVTIHISEGDTVNVGDVVVTFDGEGSSKTTKPEVSAATVEAPAPAEAAVEAPAAASAVGTVVAAPPAPRRTTAAAAPAVRKLARERGVDLDSITGTGPGGRVIRSDVERHGAEVAVSGRVLAPPGAPDTDKWGAIRREPLSQIRKTIATHMSRSTSTIPHVTHIDEVDITDLERLRAGLNEEAGDKLKLTIMSFVIRATCLALRKFPIFNASFDEEGGQIIYKDYVNMGIAVDTERGLVVPVIRNADRLGMRGLATELRSIADRIRSGRFAIDDLRGGTFTITNVGALGGLFFTPIINYPEVAILGLGRSRQAPVVCGKEIGQATMLPVSLSFDHRATDGANAARFVGELMGYLKTPAKFLADWVDAPPRLS